MRLPLVKEVLDCKTEQDNRDSNDGELDCIAQDLRPMKLLQARVLQDRGLEDEELDGNQREENERDGNLPERGLAGRDQTVEGREQERVKNGQDAESAWRCQKAFYFSSPGLQVFSDHSCLSNAVS